MKMLCNFQTGEAVRYEHGDRVIIVRGQTRRDKLVAAAGESGTVLRQVSSDDRRLAHSLYIEIRLDRSPDEPVRGLRSDLKPEKIPGSTIPYVPK